MINKHWRKFYPKKKMKANDIEGKEESFSMCQKFRKDNYVGIMSNASHQNVQGQGQFIWVDETGIRDSFTKCASLRV